MTILGGGGEVGETNRCPKQLIIFGSVVHLGETYVLKSDHDKHVCQVLEPCHIS